MDMAAILRLLQLSK